MTKLSSETQVSNPAVSSRIDKAFKLASRATEADFSYLLKTAMQESSLDPQAKARTSSASGLFQFVERTWLDVLKDKGEELGLGRYANQIQRSPSGRLHVSDPSQRREILALRHDPEVSALVAGALTERNAAYLEKKLGRAASDGELYMAHFLGGRGAYRLIDQVARQPDANASQIFPRQARANRAIFYEANGAPRSVQDVYAVLAAKIGTTTPSGGAVPPTIATRVATAGPETATAYARPDLPNGQQAALQKRISSAFASLFAVQGVGRNDGQGAGQTVQTGRNGPAPAAPAEAATALLRQALLAASPPPKPAVAPALAGVPMPPEKPGVQPSAMMDDVPMPPEKPRDLTANTAPAFRVKRGARTAYKALNLLDFLQNRGKLI